MDRISNTPNYLKIIAVVLFVIFLLLIGFFVWLYQNKPNTNKVDTTISTSTLTITGPTVIGESDTTYYINLNTNGNQISSYLLKLSYIAEDIEISAKNGSIDNFQKGIFSTPPTETNTLTISGIVQTGLPFKGTGNLVALTIKKAKNSTAKTTKIKILNTSTLTLSTNVTQNISNPSSTPYEFAIFPNTTINSSSSINNSSSLSSSTTSTSTIELLPSNATLTLSGNTTFTSDTQTYDILLDTKGEIFTTYNIDVTYPEGSMQLIAQKGSIANVNDGIFNITGGGSSTGKLKIAGSTKNGTSFTGTGTIAKLQIKRLSSVAAASIGFDKTSYLKNAENQAKAFSTLSNNPTTLALNPTSSTTISLSSSITSSTSTSKSSSSSSSSKSSSTSVSTSVSTSKSISLSTPTLTSSKSSSKTSLPKTAVGDEMNTTLVYLGLILLLMGTGLFVYQKANKYKNFERDY